eukprot:3807665-Prymnesium_polylepis.1
MLHVSTLCSSPATLIPSSMSASYRKKGTRCSERSSSSRRITSSAVQEGSSRANDRRSTWLQLWRCMGTRPCGGAAPELWSVVASRKIVMADCRNQVAWGDGGCPIPPPSSPAQPAQCVFTVHIDRPHNPIVPILLRAPQGSHPCQPSRAALTPSSPAQTPQRDAASRPARIRECHERRGQREPLRRGGRRMTWRWHMVRHKAVLERYAALRCLWHG